MADRLEIRIGGGGHYRIYDAGRPITGKYSQFALAEARLLNIRQQRERDRKSKVRPCLTCGQTFKSEGAHNRMCDGCRSRARSGMADLPVSAPREGRPL